MAVLHCETVFSHCYHRGLIRAARTHMISSRLSFSFHKLTPAPVALKLAPLWQAALTLFRSRPYDCQKLFIHLAINSLQYKNTLKSFWPVLRVYYPCSKQGNLYWVNNISGLTIRRRHSPCPRLPQILYLMSLYNVPYDLILSFCLIFLLRRKMVEDVILDILSPSGTKTPLINDDLIRLR